MKENGGKPDRKPYPLPYGLSNPCRNLKYENSQNYAQKPQRDCMFMNSASGQMDLTCDGFVLPSIQLFKTAVNKVF